MASPTYETLLYEEYDGVAWVTLNRPEVHNAFNRTMQHELRGLWHDLRGNDDVGCVVLTGAGDKAFCTGIDRNEIRAEGRQRGTARGTWDFEDPGQNLCPKTNNLWKPVVAAVNGMACGGAFYMLGEVDFIIAADHATFFDPHVTYGMTAAFEPIHMLAKMPFSEIMRMSLLGAYERMSAERAHQVGLVSQVVPAADLHDAAEWAATTIAAQPAIAVQGTLRALWAGRELSRRQGLDTAYLFTGLGTNPDSIAEGQSKFASGSRAEWRLR